MRISLVQPGEYIQIDFPMSSVCVCLDMCQVQRDYAEYQRELVATAMAGAPPTLMTGLPPQSKSTTDPLPNPQL